jgi:peptidoglycan/LPS O-acetylase OafA/YrhL
MNVRAERFPLMDSMRAIAALSILMFHAGYFGGLLRDDFVGHEFVGRLDVGVTIFFVISGFLLYRPFVRARLHGETAPEVAAYAWRRFLRIVPAYWVALTLVTAVLALPYVFSLKGIPLFYGFGQIYNSEHAFGGIAQAWTLCVEVTFYAFLPIWAFGMRKLGRGATARERMRGELVALALLFAGSVLAKVIALKLADLHSPQAQVPVMPLWNFLDHFAIGMALAVVSVWLQDHPEDEPRLLKLHDRYPSIAWGIGLVTFVIVSLFVTRGQFGKPLSPPAFLIRHELYGLIGFALILPAVFGDPARGVVRRILSNRFLLYLGLISYGLYLYQLSVITQLVRWGYNSVAQATITSVAWPVGTFAMTFVLASLSYYLVERPALSLKNKVGGRRPAPADEAIAEPAPAMAPSGSSR